MVRELQGLILIYGGLVQVIGMWFSQDKIRFTSGLWIGIAVAMFMVWHMNKSIQRAVERDEHGAISHMRSGTGIRTLVFIAIVLITYYLSIGNVILTFVGALGLKFAAYLQPFVHERFQRRNTNKQ